MPDHSAKNDPAALEKAITATTTPEDKNYHVGRIEIPKGDPPSDKGLLDFQKSMRAIGGTPLQLAVLKDIQDGKFETGKFDRPGEQRVNPGADKLLKAAVLEPNGDLKIDKLTVKRDDVEKFKASITADRPDTAALVSRVEKESKGQSEITYHADAAKIPPLDPQVQAILKQIPKETMSTRNYAELNETYHRLAVSSELSDLNARVSPVEVQGIEKKNGMRVSGIVEKVEQKDGRTTVTLAQRLDDHGKAIGPETTLSFADVLDKARPAATTHPLEPLTQAQPGDKLVVEQDKTGMNFKMHTERDGKVMESVRGPHAAQTFGDPVAYDSPVQNRQPAHMTR